MTTIDRDRLRKLADAATPEPWEAASFQSQRGTVTRLVFTDRPMGVGPVGRDEDVEFIAAAREAVPALLDALEQAEDDSFRQRAAMIREQDRATRAEAQSEVRRLNTAYWKERAEGYEARIQAVQDEFARAHEEFEQPRLDVIRRALER